MPAKNAKVTETSVGRPAGEDSSETVPRRGLRGALRLPRDRGSRLRIGLWTVAAGAIGTLLALLPTVVTLVAATLVFAVGGAIAGSAAPAGKHRWRLAAAAGVMLLAGTAVSTQYFVPPLMTDNLRSQLAALGTIKYLRVSPPFPAITEVFTHHIASVDAHMAAIDLKRLPTRSPAARGGVAGLLGTASGVENANVQVDQVTDGGPAVAHNLRIIKQGSSLSASAVVNPSELEPVLEQLLGMSNLHLSAQGGNLLMSFSAPQLGSNIAIRLFAGDGALEEQFVGQPGAAATPMFKKSSRFSLQSLTATQVGGNIDLTLTASVH